MFDVHSHFVIPYPKKGTHVEAIPSTCQLVVADEFDTPFGKTFNRFLATEPDAVLFFEYPYNWKYVQALKDRGIKVLWMPMMDSVGTPWLRKEGVIDLVDLYLCPTKACYEVFSGEGLPAIYIPWPIDTDYFDFHQRGEDEIVTFVHNVGRGGDGNRKGWDIMLRAWQQIDHSKANLIVHSQKHIDPKLLKGVEFHKGDLAESRDLYLRGDVYVSPSRKEGLGLPFREAMSMGMPVIGSNIPPINEVLTIPEQLVKVGKERRIGPVQNGMVYEPHLPDLVDKINFVINCGDLQDRSREARRVIEDEHSRGVLVPVYETVFEEICR